MVLATGLRIPDLSWDVVAVNVGVLEEHVQAPLVLGQWMSGNPTKESIKLVVMDIARQF